MRLLFPRFLYLFLLASTALSLRTNLVAQTTQTVAGFDATNMLKSLEAMKARQKQAQQKVVSEAYNKIQEAVATPNAAWNLYLDAIKSARFSGRTSGAVEFQEWRQKTADKIRTPEMQKALQFHLRYLGLTLRKLLENPSVPDTALIQDLNRYVNDFAIEDANLAKVFALKEQKEAQSLLQEDIGKSIFVDYLNLGGRLGELKEWETSPGKIDGILDKSLRPELRKTKSEALPKTWDWQIDLERKHALADKLSSSKDKFEQQRLPLLQWMRAKEFLNLDNPKRAIVDMFAVIQAYPAHSDVEKWIAELEKLLQEQINPSESVTNKE